MVKVEAEWTQVFLAQVVNVQFFLPTLTLVCLTCPPLFTAIIPSAVGGEGCVCDGEWGIKSLGQAWSMRDTFFRCSGLALF